MKIVDVRDFSMTTMCEEQLIDVDKICTVSFEYMDNDLDTTYIEFCCYIVMEGNVLVELAGWDDRDSDYGMHTTSAKLKELIGWET